jgi:hypothetical protein
MMDPMQITLTCACGQKHAVPNEAGAQFACSACGKALTVPAMGVLATAKPKPNSHSPPAAVAYKSTSRNLGLALIAAAIFIFMCIGIGWRFWIGLDDTPTEEAKIVRNEVPPKKAPDPPSPPKDQAPPVPVPPPRADRDKEAFVELERILFDSYEELVLNKAKTPPKPPSSVMDPVPQVGELPNPFLLKPIDTEPAPKVVEKRPPNVIDPIQLVWKLKADDTFYQELVVLQKPTFKVPPGIVVQSVLQYRIVSRFTVKKRNEDGSLVVEQKIESANLLQADDLTKSAVAGAVMQMKGTTYTLHLSPAMDVTKFEGKAGDPKLTPVAGGMGMQMTSLVDRDGWKELAQATFFQMDRPLKVKDRWQKPMTHNWGALGAWSGQITYLYFGKQDNFHKVGYQLNLAYKAPGAGAVGMMKINGATFQPPQAEGMLLFDSVKGRTVAAEERFRVRGLISVNLFGQNTQIEVEEDQHFQIRIHDKLVQ